MDNVNYVNEYLDINCPYKGFIWYVILL